MLAKIVSGGQTGVDRGALDAAIEAGFAHGGWCPKGRKAEDGAIPARYALLEMRSSAYRARTRRNVTDSDGTLILFFGEITGGTRETLLIAQELGKPVLTLDCRVKPIEDAALEAAVFIDMQSIATPNVAGPRESTRPGAAAHAQRVVAAVLMLVRSRSERSSGR